MIVLAVVLGVFAVGVALNALGVGEQESTAPDPSAEAVVASLAIAAALAAGAVWALTRARK